MKNFLIILLILPFLFVGCKYSLNSNLDKTKEIGNSIIINIELYKKEKGNHLEKLTDLIPKYYNIIPKSKSGTQKFNYYYDKEKQVYKLCSTFGLTGSYCFFSDKNEWIRF